MIKTNALLALFITTLLFAIIVMAGLILSTLRQDTVEQEITTLFNELNELQTYNLLTDIYGDEVGCIAAQQQLQNIGPNLWDLGIKLDQYRIATEQFQRSAFYQQQKVTFNQRQLIYFLLLQKLEQDCNTAPVIVSYYYRNADECPTCDDQSFVLTDIKRQFRDDIDIFSFDLDLQISAIHTIADFHNVSFVPCTIIGNQTLCSLHSKTQILDALCQEYPQTCTQ